MTRFQDLISSLKETVTLPTPFPRAEEAAFLRDYGERFALSRRAAGASGFLLWTAFLWWDVYNQENNRDVFKPETLKYVLLLRGIGIATLLATVVVSMRRRFVEDAYAHLVLLGSVFIATLCLIGMVVIVPSPLDYIYYFVGLYLVMIFMFGFLQLRAQPILICTALIVATLLAVQFGVLGSLAPTLLRSVDFKPGMFYFSSVCLIGFGISVKFERYARQQYDHERQIEAKMDALLMAKEREQHLAHQVALEQASNTEKLEALVQAKERERLNEEKKNADKSTFLANAAHDLRQPMFGLSLSLEALRLSIDSDDHDETARLLALSQRSARMMANTFNAVLDMSKLDSGLVSAQFSHFDLVEVIEEAIGSMNEFAKKKNVRVRARVPQGAPVVVHSDRLWLSLILKNLISNGIKYNKSVPANNATVLIGVVRLSNRIRLDVVDNGLGIPESQWQRVFEPFVQLNNAERDREKGLGLGLSIVVGMIGKLPEHGLEFKSNVGKGTRFSIDVPRGQDDSSLGPRLDLGSAPKSVAGAYVILVEDDILVRTAMDAMLQQWGMLVDTAANLDELEHLLQRMERYPDLVMSDYRLPNEASARDVVALLTRYLHANDSNRSIPVLVVTGEAYIDGLSEQVGAAAVLAKPVQPEHLRATLESLLTTAVQQEID